MRGKPLARPLVTRGACSFAGELHRPCKRLVGINPDIRLDRMAFDPPGVERIIVRDGQEEQEAAVQIKGRWDSICPAVGSPITCTRPAACKASTAISAALAVASLVST